jgi:DNA repair ATPase RecN
MESRLSLCVQHLQDVRAKLTELRASAGKLTERAQIAEALSFVKKAIDAVSYARERIEELPTEARRLEVQSSLNEAAPRTKTAGQDNPK